MSLRSLIVIALLFAFVRPHHIPPAFDRFGQMLSLPETTVDAPAFAVTAGAPGTGPVFTSTPNLGADGEWNCPQYAADFTAAGARHGVNPGFLDAMAYVESTCNPSAGSPAGARGCMQIMPGTARNLGVDALNCGQAIDGAARYVHEISQIIGSSDAGLIAAGYNAGPNRDSLKAGRVPNISETRDHVDKVADAWAR